MLDSCTAPLLIPSCSDTVSPFSVVVWPISTTVSLLPTVEVDSRRVSPFFPTVGGGEARSAGLGGVGTFPLLDALVSVSS